MKTVPIRMVILVKYVCTQLSHIQLSRIQFFALNNCWHIIVAHSVVGMSNFRGLSLGKGMSPI